MALGRNYTASLLWIFICLTIQMVSGRAVEKSTLTLKFLDHGDLYIRNVSCGASCGSEYAIVHAHCKQTKPGFPFVIYCEASMTPKIDIFEVSFTNIAKLDGKFMMADNGNGNYWLKGLLPMFAHGTYYLERRSMLDTGAYVLPPKGHYELESIVVNQDGYRVFCARCVLDVVP